MYIIVKMKNTKIGESMKAIIKSSDNKHYIFCYGTLKKYNRNHYMMDGATYIGDARLHNVTMVDLGSYPGLIKGNGSVVGEVYCVGNQKKKDLDIFEEVGSLYSDKEAIVYIEDRAYLVHYYEMIEDGKDYPLCKDVDTYYRVDPAMFIWYIGDIKNISYLKKEMFDDKEGYLILKKDVSVTNLKCVGTHYDAVDIYKKSTLN